MTGPISTFFKVNSSDGIVKPLDFGAKHHCKFNYVDFDDDLMLQVNNEARLEKQMVDSFALHIRFDKKHSGVVKELKVTNQNILTWEDYWIDSCTKGLVNPQIERVNLQKNSLLHANFNLPRPHLKGVNLEGNYEMRAVIISEAENLEVLNLNNCPRLEVINLGENRSIKAILARNCNMPEVVMQRLLRDFTPTLAASSNSEFNLFRVNCNTVLDLRGNEIPWGNTRIASKIRLLLCNNWMVLWDNYPPTTIVPPQMYSFFTSGLEEELIKQYYSF